MNALTDPRFSDLVGGMPQTTFVEAFLLLSPSYFIVPYRDIHRPIHPFVENLKQLKLLEERFDEFANNLARIIRTRVAGGQQLGLPEFTHLLACAASMADVPMAQQVWQAMKDHEVEPDTQCYNHFMETHIWEGTFTGLEKYRMRVTPYSYEKRKHGYESQGWSGYGTGRRSVRKIIRVLFQEMVDRAVPPNEETFANLLLGYCRGGWVPGMKDILRVTWNIDVDEVKAESDWSRLSEVKHNDPASPLYPTERLLFAVAHAFGTNNDIDAAISTVEFISAQYKIPIPERVWMQLFEWAFVLSRRRFGRHKEQMSLGHISSLRVIDLFEKMTAEPHNVRPTMVVRCKLAKIAWDRKILRDYKAQMAAAYKILKETRQRQLEARSVIEAYMKRRRPQNDHTHWQSREFSDAIYTYDILRLHTTQQTEFMDKLARNMLINRLWTGRNNYSWQRTLFPSMLEEWEDFLPKEFIFHMRTGLVYFHGDIGWGSAYRYSGKRIPIRRPTPHNDVEPGDEVNYIDDEFFWRAVLRLNPDIEPTSPSLRRLFDPVLRTETPLYVAGKTLDQGEQRSEHQTVMSSN
ncbi:uncharacterized protein BO97DRAFT_340135 [Aspergillus homomorphus CBS 101889]|uniref:Mitochondrial ATPase expression-domain-containing protein n=1 Tax=Aspergillus homomorphus (strain CBS 101889) TaxID=1450537 RepID=A0A395I3I1_ASPHC|nr:hypothetical protein BO97DRAFT_340135 [Aspergillus homomorphus CBS 101889]RAL14640.1 hypothetical protein BO97DRAFT_340135 [Aspergillus homomorphus CBS 101889]